MRTGTGEPRHASGPGAGSSAPTLAAMPGSRCWALMRARAGEASGGLLPVPTAGQLSGADSAAAVAVWVGGGRAPASRLAPPASPVQGAFGVAARPDPRIDTEP